MKILAFDTSLDKTYIALTDGVSTFQKVIKSDEKNYHSAYLISGLKEIAKKADIAFKDLDLIAVNQGPGSFTGIRVGVTVARTMAKELNLNVTGINSLEILEKNYEEFLPQVILDARKNQFYFKGLTGISLVNYDEIGNFINKDFVVCDKSSFSHLLNPEKPLLSSEIKVLNFEEDENNLALSLIELARKKVFGSLTDKNCVTDSISGQNGELKFPWHELKPLYIQLPPIYSKK